MVWASGQQLQGGKYVIEQVLGRGGFGITYKARHTMLNAFVVIKTPNDDLKNDPEYPKFIKRFREEGQRLEKLSETQHPNIVRVRDLFHEGGTYCLVMDFVQGDSLFNLIQKTGALPTEEAVKYISQIGDALKIVHQAGLVHRDAHPGNIMVQQDGKAVLIDFGIAGEIIPKTISSKVFANPAFAPYEQMRGDRKPSVDIYSLAASLYYAVTGKFPEAAINRRLYSMALVSPQEHISSISNELNQAILKGMELEPENRPQTMQEWLELLADEVVTIWTSGYQLQNGKYTIERDIAQGGFGITYLARDENNQRVVIKTLNETVQRRPDFAKLQQDFVNEAVKLAKCNHPHIVKVNEVFQEKHLWCIAMEYIEGEHLADRVVNGGVLSEAEAVGYIRQIGEALTVVHSNGLLHRDVKPANIIVRSNQREAVLIDFGIAREFVPSITKLHTPYLSHCFAPIEQYESVAKRGAYTDVYALAATLYFLLTNRLPYPAITRASGVVLDEPISINPSISIRVNRAILKGMELKPENRPQTMQEWLELLKKPISTQTTPSNSLAQNKSTPVKITAPWGWFTGMGFGYILLGFFTTLTLENLVAKAVFFGWVLILTVFCALGWTKDGAWAAYGIERGIISGFGHWCLICFWSTGGTMLSAVPGLIFLIPNLSSTLWGNIIAFVMIIISFAISAFFPFLAGVVINAWLSEKAIINISQNRTKESYKLLEYYTKIEVFLFLLGTCVIGLSLGWFLNSIFMRK
jgi:serine/threonine protein kinase